MRRVPNDSPKVRADEIADMLASPPLGLEGLFDDPSVRCRVGERISQAMHKPIWGTRKRRVADARRQCAVKLPAPGR
jgi:hypothetical protein